MREDGKGISVVSVGKSSLLSRDSEAMLLRLFFEIQKPLPQSLTNVTDFSKVIPTIETFFREEDPPRRLTKMKW